MISNKIKTIVYIVANLLPLNVWAGSAGLPNPLSRVGVTNLPQFLILVGNALQQLGVPFLVLAIAARAFWFIAAQKGGKPQERAEFLIHIGFILLVGLLLLTSPTLAQIIYNTCKAMGIC